MTTLTDIILPAEQLEGTSATLSAWLVKQGQEVAEGDPIIELETDKVSMEVCAPVAGVIHDMAAQVGDKVEPDVVLGHIAPAGSQPTAQVMYDDKPKPKKAQQASATANEITNDASARHLISPAVRRLLKEHSLNIDWIQGSGKRGRVNRDDVLAYLTNPTHTSQANAVQPVNPIATPFSSGVKLETRPLQGKLVPHTNMRKSIANHMVESLLNTSPHVTSVFELDMSNIIAHRKWHKKEYAELGVNLTFTAYFLAAMVKAVQKVPQTNARFHQDALEIFDDINIGVGTALGDAGLVVPVVQQVQTMNLFEIAQALNEQTNKARDGKLKPADMQNGSITISNHGVSGSLFASPIIINQPQVAIVGIGKMEKRVKVTEINGEDTMQIKPMCYVSLSIDHRALDAHQTNMFLAEFVKTLETWGE